MVIRKQQIYRIVIQLKKNVNQILFLLTEFGAEDMDTEADSSKTKVSKQLFF